MEVTDISSNILLHNLSKLLLDNLTNSTYNLTTEQQTLIECFIKKCPNFLDNITKNIIEMTKDGKIDLYDIPIIIQLLTETYHLYSVTEGLLQGNNNIVFIQYTINVIIDSEFILLPEVEKKKIENVVNSCIVLLRTNIISTTITDNKNFYSKN